VLDLPIPVLTTSTGVAGQLVILILAAVVGGYLAVLLRAPLVVGYIIGGLIVGPSVSGLVEDIDDVEFVGELGVALLLFSIGLEFPLEQFRTLGRKLYAAALIQIGILGIVGYAIAVGFGLSAPAATLVAGAMAFSSTALLVRLLAQSPNRNASDARWVLSIALVQDLVAVPLLVVLPELGETTGGELVTDVLIAAAKGIGLVAGVLILGRLLVPWILKQALTTGSRELFLLTTFALASGVAVGSFAVGLSLAFGAFLAGIATAQSVYATRALHELVPLRDVFAATFFVSIGVLLDLSVVGDDMGLFFSLLIWGAVGKIILIFALARWSRFDATRSLRMGLLIGQVGEFSFLLVAAASPASTDEAGGIVIAVGAVSMGVSAALIRLTPRIEALLLRLPAIASRWTFAPEVGDSMHQMRQHTVIAGYGETGREIAHMLRRREFRYAVVDSDPNLPEELAHTDTPYIWGDLANPATLDASILDHARVLAITIPDMLVVEAVIRRVREDYPRLHIVARGEGPRSNTRLRRAGANVVVLQTLEVGLEVAHHVARRYGVTSAEIRSAAAQRREDYEED
jgi:CPA2 family monovalent cation:H+ antiporter-2